MDTLQQVKHLTETGRFRDALEALDKSSVHGGEHQAADVMRAHLLERTGDHDQARSLVQQLNRSKGLSPADRSTCELILGSIEYNEGENDSSLVHHQRSVRLAEEVGDRERIWLSQLWLWRVFCEQVGVDAAFPLLTQLRAAALKLGKAHLTASLHILVGETEGKRGHLASARGHARLGQRLLSAMPNVWLEAWAENIQVGSLVLESDIEAGLVHGKRALTLAEESGCAMTLRAVVANFGNLSYELGEFDRAVEYLERSMRILPSMGEVAIAVLDTLATVRLAQGRLEEAAHLLERVAECMPTPQDSMRYSYRHAEVPRALLLGHEGRWSDALMCADLALALATRANDDWLRVLALMARAESLHALRRHAEAFSALAEMTSSLAIQHARVPAFYEGLLARILAATDNIEAGAVHYERAMRIYDTIRDAPGRLQLVRGWRQLTADTCDLPALPQTPPVPTRSQFTARSAVHAVASLLLHTGRPRVLAGELTHLLEQTNCVVKALVKVEDGAAGLDAVSDAGAADTWRSFWISGTDQRRIEVVAQARPDAESAATLNALTVILGAIDELRRSRAEREEQTALWPIADAPVKDDEAVVTGSLVQLMTLANRIARSTASVLITGESGTGKEILARAIHAASERVAKPFVPFNCTAVPREMLESQFFGHRRGAFTGADRDYPGLIRSAREGTLFLDEIGHLGFDLQPKLLRFLGSGEICPLGETKPIVVDVRLIAATNVNLEQLVKVGQFREDLFYRLNVIRFDIPPLRERRDEIPAFAHHFLARAAAEFDKGQLRFAPETLERLLIHDWPGNIRQLQNEIRRMAALAEPSALLTPADLSRDVAGNRSASFVQRHNGSELTLPLAGKLGPTVARLERQTIDFALRSHGGHSEAAARALGISRKGLYLKRQRLHV